MQSFIRSVEEAIEAEQGGILSILLSYKRSCSNNLKDEIIASRTGIFPVGNPLWKDVILTHLRICKVYLNKEKWEENIIETATLQIQLAQQFHQIFSGVGRWVLPALFTINREMRELCILADNTLESQGNKRTKLEEAVRTTYKAFTYCATDRFSPRESSRKWGTYEITNLLFRTYFYLDSTNLCTNIFRALGASDLPDFTDYPQSHKVTFCFYRGVLEFIQGNFQKANTDLEFSFNNMIKNQPSNKRHVLKYYIPLRLTKGILPTATLLKKYKVPSLYGEFIKSIQYGDVCQFKDLLETNMDILLEWGVFFLFEKLEWVCLRNLFKTMYVSLTRFCLVSRFVIYEKETKLPYTLFIASYQASFRHNKKECDIEEEEIECILVNMIDKGYMKGYLSHEKKTVVLSKADPFPELGSIPFN